MRFRKVKFDNEKQKWTFVYEVQRGEDNWDEFSVASKDEPKRELIEARDEMIKFVQEICELPGDYKSRISIIGITFTYTGDDEVMGAVISAKMDLTYSNAPLILNTPHKIAEFYGETGDPNQLMPDGMADALDKLQEEAEKYVKGERAQGGLFENVVEMGSNAGKAAKQLVDSMQKMVDDPKSMVESVSISSGEGKLEIVKGKKRPPSPGRGVPHPIQP